MAPASSLWIFFGLVFGIVLLPGLDMACVLASSVADGRRAGLAAVGGITTAAVAHVAIGALGIAAILGVMPILFNALLLLGAAYIAWIGLALARSGLALEGAFGDGRAVLAGGTEPAGAGLVTAYRRGLLTNLLNPKAYVFMLAVFPQFVRPEWGPVWLQAVVLGAIIIATQLAVYGPIALAAARARHWLAARPRVLAGVGRAIGLLLIAVALYSTIEGWRAGG
jgi:threonine/homoserine/homoserine lactone efflux protein